MGVDYLLIAALILLSPFILAGIANTYYGIRYHLPFVPSRKKAIDQMFEYGDIRAGMTVLDLGSGAGDILLEAARRGVRAVGVEINPFLVLWTRIRARYAGLSSSITVVRGDIFSLPFPACDRVVMYLPSHQTKALCGKLAGLPPHVRIISHGYEMKGWKKYPGTDDVHVYRIEDI